MTTSIDQYDLIKFAAATNNEIYDQEYKNGEWMYYTTETHETFDNFVDSSDKYWNESTKAKFGEIAGFKFLAFSEMQIKKGAPRHSLSIVDFGDIRVAIRGCDLSDFT